MNKLIDKKQNITSFLSVEITHTGHFSYRLLDSNYAKLNNFWQKNLSEFVLFNRRIRNFTEKNLVDLSKQLEIRENLSQKNQIFPKIDLVKVYKKKHEFIISKKKNLEEQFVNGKPLNKVK